MLDPRLELAFGDGPPDGQLLILGASGQTGLAGFDPARSLLVQGHFPDHRALAAQGWQVLTDPPEGPLFDAALVFLPRAKAEAHALIHAASARLRAGGALWIDGQKTDGVDSLLKDLRGRAAVAEQHSKAHGRIFRIDRPDGDWLPADWAAAPHQAADGFVTLPGVFSADGVDPGSALLAAHLPPRLPSRMVDLGAGWGWLAAQILAREGVETLHLVEADHAALDCARRNLNDARPQFHWADARDFTLPEPVNGVVMNPPFHDGRAADPGLGTAFIATAARLLTGAGRLWMVANRHLPYEAALARHFARVDEIGGDARFKIIEATGARRAGKGGKK
ncbi:class I SAM-dependent methyltransferase [Paracoccus sp. M683]|uniref:class I SAM-dependent methyltransferase n=1 Tax=Paracoccus sp. M683 TaxID=2594268 RepID=UPI00117EF018|nr:class I SAM-dependent methyltransferase [Paracoccus sp. M683]TRW96829.1 class I SAM-dependent methyltransferase [Paracoccus sp. M683]